MIKFFILFLVLCNVTGCDIDEAAESFRNKTIRDPIFPYYKNPYDNSDPNYLEAIRNNLNDTSTVCAIKYDDLDKKM